MNSVPYFKHATQALLEIKFAVICQAQNNFQRRQTTGSSIRHLQAHVMALRIQKAWRAFKSRPSSSLSQKERVFDLHTIKLHDELMKSASPLDDPKMHHENTTPAEMIDASAHMLRSGKVVRRPGMSSSLLSRYDLCLLENRGRFEPLGLDYLKNCHFVTSIVSSVMQFNSNHFCRKNQCY